MMKYTDFTADLNAGYWLVIVSYTVDEVYNPMLVGVYYSANGSDNTMTSNLVNADSNWTLKPAMHMQNPPLLLLKRDRRW